MADLPTIDAGRPLEIWAVSDGRAGIENQVLGLSEAIARLAPARITPKRLRFQPRWDRLPTALKLNPRKLLDPASDVVEPPWPDLWIGAGRAAVPFALRLKRWSKGETFVVQVQDPRWPPQMFDVVVPPRHDRVHGDNLVEITGSPHRVTAEKLAAEYERFRERIEPLPSPRVAVLIGGKSKAFDMSPERAAKTAAEIGLAVETEGGSLLMTFSRRTPARARAILKSRLEDLPGIVWDGTGDNPYFAFLAAADYVLVTEDSTNMAAEAASTGKPVFIVKMDGDSLKFRRFHEELERLDAARPFGGQLYRWEYEPLRETERAAAEILRRWRDRAAARA
ncbi:MAG TPA: mitochondrial fission ELM1 family protein [Caulobacteraceae bacterium]|nr:mitochondrial fission ELM1 family protein [Caulobacteraceae bacterium]